MIENKSRTVQILGGPTPISNLSVLQRMIQGTIGDIVELRKELPTAPDKEAVLRQITLQAELLTDMMTAEDAWLADMEAERANEIESLCRSIDELDRGEG